MPCSSRALIRVASVNRGGGSVKCWIGVTSSTVVVVALAEVREPAGLLVVGAVVVATLGVHAGEAVEQDSRRRRSEGVRAVDQLDRGGFELLGRHLRGERPLPDEPVQAELVGLERSSQRIGVAEEARRSDRLVRLLGALGLRLVDTSLRHRVVRTETVADDVPSLAHRDARHRRRVGPHVGDEADLAVGGGRRPRTGAARSTSSASG